MAIKFCEKRKMFIIETENSLYAFNQDSGNLRSVWWGSKVDDTDGLYIIPSEKYRIIGDAYLENKRYNTEYTGWGNCFYSEPTLKVTFGDGVRELDLRYEKYEICDDKKCLRIILKDSVYDFSVELIYRIFDGLDIIDRNCIIHNKTGATITIFNAASAAVNFPHKAEPYRLTSMGSAWGHEYELIRTPVTKAKTVLESRTGLCNTNNYPYFAIDEGKAEENSGEVWFGTLQWSGNWKITAEYDLGMFTRIVGGINDFDFSYQLKNNESFETPIFTLGYSSNGFSGASRQLHDYIRKYQYGGYWTDKCLPIRYNHWSAFGYNINQEKLMQLADKAAEIGIELFVLDDGWYSSGRDLKSGLGDWYPAPELFKNGLKPLIDRVKSNGMLFGIWIEPEMVSLNTELYKKHPDWVLHFETRERELKLERLILNLAREDVFEYLKSVFDNLLDNYEIDYIKWDMNRWFSQVGDPLNSTQQQMIWVKYVRNLHRLFAYLLDKNPKLIIENCASGGLRNNLGLAKYCSLVNRSDNQDPVDSLYLHEGFTYVNPSRSAGGGGHISPNFSGLNKRDCPMEFKAHVGLLGTLGVSMDLNNVTIEEKEELKNHIAFNKKVRHIVQLGDMYRLASLRETDYMAVEFVTKEKDEALILLYAPSRTFIKPYPPIKLFGLEKDKIYEVGGDVNEIKYFASGEVLMKCGIPSSNHTDGTLKSKIIHIKEVN